MGKPLPIMNTYHSTFCRRHAPLSNPRYFVSPPYGGVIRFAWTYSHRGTFYYYFYNNKRSDSFFLLLKYNHINILQFK